MRELRKAAVCWLTVSLTAVSMSACGVGQLPGPPEQGAQNAESDMEGEADSRDAENVPGSGPTPHADIDTAVKETVSQQTAAFLNSFMYLSLLPYQAAARPPVQAYREGHIGRPYTHKHKLKA